MRKFALLAVLAALFGFGNFAATPAVAGGDVYYRDSDRRVVVRNAYCSGYRYRPINGTCVDPYEYRYEPRRYYPYYNSGYWKPAWVLRQRGRTYYNHPPYYQAWGYPNPYYVSKRVRRW